MIIADTGFWLALANKKDNHHQTAHDCLKRYAEPLITTHPVITETCHLLLQRIGQHAVMLFLENIKLNQCEIFPLKRDHIPRMIKLMQSYHDLPMDYTDASLVILAEHLGNGRIFSTDNHDFAAYRWKNHNPFQNLLQP